MKNIILALFMLCSFANAEKALLTLDSNSHDHTESCDCQDSCGCEDACACHNNAHAYAPIGVMGSHVHKKGQVMFSYRFMFMDMDGLRDGDSRVGDSENRGAGKYMMLPDDMTMKMHMLGMMYGVTDDLTVGVMLPWIETDMDVKAGMTGSNRFRTRADGIGDIKLSSMYRLWNDEQNTLLLNLGISLPTGTINEERNGQTLGYPMQLGSGTVDFMPGLTFSGNTENWAYGVQAIATLRTHRNYRGYNKGNAIKFNTWISRKITKNFATSLRIELNSWDDYEGHDDGLHGRRNMMPTADNDLRGGTRADAFLGFNYLFTEGVLKNNNIGIEIGMPFYQNIEGPNLETDLILTIGWQMTF